ncbi:hypothetical protein [Aquimarina litoralis]|uniref:hypothetical protein n=1 Tax=Aquimarina litoralis TaxID=584605 RepID=UPI001C5812C9|nr:hypothetical protein [Aquimarina litoralis]MBW1298442.1 hypothetical protein [Aquimarina litoralis]
MRKNIILGVLSCLFLFACEQNEELTEIETITTKAFGNSGGNTNSAIPDLTYEDGTPVHYTIEDIEVVVIYEPGTTESQKAVIRANHATEFGPVQVTPCSSNSNGETWSYQDLVIHNWRFVPYPILNIMHKQHIEAEDPVERAALVRISHTTYQVNDPNIVCD